MKKLFRLLTFAAVIGLLMGYASLRRDLDALEAGLLRLHVVADSDSGEDQAVKLRVRDAVTELLGSAMDAMPDLQSAEDYIREKLPEIRQSALDALHRAGVDTDISVSLETEPFPARDYATFRLPAGNYKTLRITIGSGQGHNWWCVLFPSLCTPAAVEDFQTQAADCMSDTLTQTLSSPEPKYQLRFRCLDLLGELRNRLRGDNRASIDSGNLLAGQPQ